MEYRLPFKIRAVLGQATEQGYPLGGIMETPERLYLGTVSGFIPKPEPKRKGRPKTPAAKMLRYCRFLAEWANPVTNPQLLETAKPEARRRAFKTAAGDAAHESIQRKSQRDEAESVGWLEVLLHRDGAVEEVLVFPVSPGVASATSAVRIVGNGWRFRSGGITHGEIVLTIGANNPAAIQQRIERERTILCIHAPPDI